MPSTSIKALDALQEAHKIAFAPFVFQAVVCLRKFGIFDAIFESRKKGGLSIKEITNQLSVSEYGVGVLFEIAESSDIVEVDYNGNYQLTTTGYFLSRHETVDININFTHDVCYNGLFHLYESIKNGKPEGLKTLGDWPTIYQGLSKLKPQEKKSWFEFDHHYSDHIFEEALPILFKYNPKTVFDIGANTGKFTISCCKYDNNVKVTMIDLPGQLNIALKNTETEGFKNRVSGYEIDWLAENPKIPTGADVIWMCQFLDCFAKVEIKTILKTCVESMDSSTRLLIMETFTDRQKFENAKFILEATSLYFTAMANGNSKMYKATEFFELLDEVGLTLEEDVNIGEYHTVLVCKKK